MARTSPQRISGPWDTGYALDKHTLRSVYLGVDETGTERFDTTWSELGELVNRLKYRNDWHALPGIVETAVEFLSPFRPHFDMIVPVPASIPRPVQPVTVIARMIGEALELPMEECVFQTSRPTRPLKDITNIAERQQALSNLFTVNMTVTNRKNVLLFDDLFRSGATLNAVTNALLRQGACARVDVLVLTYTRSKR